MEPKNFFVAGWGRRIALAFVALSLVFAVSAISQDTIGGKAFKSVAKLKTPRFGCAATVIGDDIYIIGGDSHGALLPEVERYDVLENKVSKLTDKLIPRRYHTAESYDGKIYIIGGVHQWTRRSLLEEIRNVECYDPATNEIKKLSPMPTPRKLPASVVHSGKIYVIGGSAVRPLVGGREWYYDTVEIYDIATDTWRTGSSMPTPRQCDVVLKDGKIYAIGGYRDVSLSAFEVYDIDTDQWQILPDMPFTLSAHHAALLGNKIYCFGDRDNADAVTEYDFATGQWKVLITNYQPSRYNAAVTFGNAIYVFGGTNSFTGYPLKDIQRFQPLAF